MTWNNILDGDDGIALTAMQNWIHSARGGFSSFYPMDSNGAYALQDLGETGKEWGDLYLDTGKKIYVGGVEFTGGGGGSASGLDILSIANTLDKSGISPVLTNASAMRNAFTTDTNLLCYLRVSYSTADTTTIYFDHGLESELEIISDCDTHGDWSGWTVPTATASISDDAVNYLEGSAVKITATVNGTAGGYVAWAGSLVDRNMRVSVYLDNVTDVSGVWLVAYASTGNYRWFEFDASGFSVDTWYHLTADLNLEDGDTSGGVTVTDTGTFERSNITYVMAGFTTTSSQTVNMTVDSVRAISDQPFLIPSYGQSIVIQDATNQELLTVTAEDLTDYTTQGKFTISATLSNNYTATAGTTYLSTTTGTIENNQFIHKSTASGQNAKTAFQVETMLLPETFDTGTLEAFINWDDEAFEVTEFPTTGTIKIYSETDKSAFFLDDNYILLYKKLRGGYRSQSMEGSDTVNYLRLKLNANATYSSPEISLAHDGSNAVGSDDTGYYVVPESVYLQYSAGSKTDSTFTTATPSKLIVNGGQGLIFEDDFDRTDSTNIGNGWSTTKETSNISHYFGLDGGRVRWYSNTTLDYVVGRIVRQDINYKALLTSGIKIKFDIIMYHSGGTYNTDCYYIGVGCADDASNDGVGVFFYPRRFTTVNSIQLYLNGASVQNFSYLINQIAGAPKFYATLTLTSNRILLELRENSHDDTVVFTGEYSQSTAFSLVNQGLKIRGYTREAVGNSYFDNLEISYLTTGYTLKYNIPDLTNIDKVETATGLKRSDTTNQAPVIYGTGTNLY